MNLFTYPHTVTTLFKLSFKLFQKNLLGMLMLTVVLLAPSLVVGLAQWFETESVVFFISMRVLESAMALGMIAVAHGSIFPISGILRSFGGPLLFGAIHVAILQYLLFVIGVMGLTVMPFPFNIIIVVLWLSSLFYFCLAQPVFILEGRRGMQAMIRSFQLVRAKFGRVFIIVVLSMLIQFSIFALLFRLFLPELDLLSAEDTEQIQIQIAAILENEGVHRAMRLSQYLTALAFFPFASLLTVLLYFDSGESGRPGKLRSFFQAGDPVFWNRFREFESTRNASPGLILFHFPVRDENQKRRAFRKCGWSKSIPGPGHAGNCFCRAIECWQINPD